MTIDKLRQKLRELQELLKQEKAPFARYCLAAEIRDTRREIREAANA